MAPASRGHDDVAAHGGCVPDLERHQEASRSHSFPSAGTAFHSGGPLKSCGLDDLAGRRDLEPSTGFTVSGGQPSRAAGRPACRWSTCGLENSQVPPPRKAWPSRHFDVLERLRPLHLDDRIEVHTIPSCLCVSCAGRAMVPAPSACRCLLQVVERRRARACRDQRRPLLGAERHGGPQEGCPTADAASRR